MEEQKTTYKDVGVDIEAGNTFVDAIKEYAASTQRIGSDAILGGFGGLFDLKKINYTDPILVSTTDGVGTKLLLADAIQDYSTIGVDLVAICVNDLLAQGAEPLFFLDYYATHKIEIEKGKEIIAGIARGCKESKCALIGGETAEMPGVYPQNIFDLAGFAVGVVEREHILPKKEKISVGDIIYGLPSSGIHSNGFSLVRYILDSQGITDKSLIKKLLAPTRMYVDTILPLVKKGYIKGIAHISGGGLEDNVVRILPDCFSAEIQISSWEIPELFSFLQNLGNIDTAEMFSVFNMGIGMAFIIDPLYKKEIADYFNTVEQPLYEIGMVTEKKDSPVLLCGMELYDEKR